MAVDEFGDIEDDALAGMAVARYSRAGVPPQLQHPGGQEYMLREQFMSTNRELMLLQMQIRRTDVELRHLTDNKSLKQFETDMLRVMTMVRSAVMMGIALDILMAYWTGGATGVEVGMAVGMMGMAGATSIGVMSELS